jgi:hypothetical protein
MHRGGKDQQMIFAPFLSETGQRSQPSAEREGRCRVAEIPDVDGV